MSGQIAEVSLETVSANVIKLPFDESTSQLASARRDCEALRQNILTVQGYLMALEGSLGGIHGAARERLLAQMVYVKKLLGLRLDQLSHTDSLLHEMLRRNRRSTTPQAGR